MPSEYMNKNTDPVYHMIGDRECAITRNPDADKADHGRYYEYWTIEIQRSEDEENYAPIPTFLVTKAVDSETYDVWIPETDGKSVIGEARSITESASIAVSMLPTMRLPRESPSVPF